MRTVLSDGQMQLIGRDGPVEMIPQTLTSRQTTNCTALVDLRWKRAENIHKCVNSDNQKKYLQEHN